MIINAGVANSDQSKGWAIQAPTASN